MGNRIRLSKGLRAIELQDIFRKQEFWEFVVARNTQQFKYRQIQKSQYTNISKSGDSADFKDTLRMEEFSDFDSTTNRVSFSAFGELDKYKNLLGKIEYSKLMKMFPHLIKSKRGKNGGTWAELYILLKIASMLDKDLEVEIYRVFIEENLLQYRDDGGVSFKNLNSAIDKYIPSFSGDNQGRYIQVAKLLRKKLGIEDSKGYNEIEHNSKVQQKRDEIEKNLIFSLETKLITSYEQLKIVIENLNI